MRASGEGQRCRNEDERALTQIKSSADHGTNQNVIPLTITSLKAACSQCNLRELCLPYGLSEKEIVKLDSMVASRRRVKRSQHLYRAGEPFEAIFAIKTGFFKTDVLLEDGRDQVTGFQMAGEILGMDGISTENHTCNAVALEDSEVCVIPFAQLEGLSREIQALQHHFHKVMSREIVRDHGVMMLLGTMRAEERLAAFLLNLSQRFTARGYSPQEFHLRMTREEIGSYLGLKLETVSRAFSRFQEEGFISVQQKHIRILDIAPLKQLLAHPPA
ncbi:MAG: fumarate/nitrate reduction transcriptional regulator Fnr [Rhodocyclales bacterium]|nr:fumarate/nitrate reduction transcriptional regulator Fnr [Rhodocyclales bacterium]